MQPAIVALTVNGEFRGDVELYIDDDWTPLLDPRFLSLHLEGELEPSIMEALTGLGRSVRPEDLIRFGISQSFNEDDLSFKLRIPAMAMRLAELPMAWRRPKPRGKVLPRENVALFLGMTGRLSPTLVIGGSAPGSFASTELSLTPSLNLFDWVLEGKTDLYWSGNAILELESARLTRDFPKLQSRLRAGFIGTEAISFQSSAVLYGASIHREAAISGEPRVATAEGEEFLLDNKADVTVSLNGLVLKRLTLKSGRYRLSDLPLASGMNDLVFTIEEEGKEPREYRLGLPYDNALLKYREADWYAAAGVERQEPWRFFGTARGAYGFSPTLTGGIDAQYGFGTAQGGLFAVMVTPIGTFQPEAALSSSWGEGGFAAPSAAARLAWKLYVPHRAYAPRVGLGIEYRGPLFAPPQQGRPSGAAAADLARERWTVSANLGQRLPWGLGSLVAAGSAGISGGALTQGAVSAGFQRGLSKSGSISFILGLVKQADGSLEPNASIGISINPDNRRYLQFRQDFIDRSESASLSFPIRPSDGSSISLSSEGLIGAPEGLRFASAQARLPIGASDWSFSTSIRDNATSAVTTIGADLQASTNLAYAGGAFGLARTLGEAFAFLLPDESIGGARVLMRAMSGAASGESVGGRPALVPNLTPYQSVEVAIELPESPPGMTPSIERTVLAPSYRSASVVRIAWKPLYYVRGRAVRRDGSPLKTAVGQVMIADTILAAARQAQDIFTDDRGSFEAYELEAGPYVIRWGDLSMSTFEVTEGGTQEVDIGQIIVISPSEEGN